MTVTASATERTEKVTARVAFHLTAASPVPSGDWTPTGGTVTAIHADHERTVDLVLVGANKDGACRGYWRLPHPTSASDHVWYGSADYGLITALPADLLEAIESAAGVRFADYATSEQTSRTGA